MGWGTLLDASRFNRAQAELDATEPPKECLYDGSLLKRHPSGVLYCEGGDYRWNG